MVSLTKMVKTGAIGLLLTGCVERDFGPPQEVVITPKTPGTNRNLKCYVDGHEDLPYEFYWFADQEHLYGSVGTKSWLDKGYTRSGDVITCEAWAPGVLDAEGFLINYTQIYIK